MGKTVNYCPYCGGDDVYWNGRVSMGMNLECRKCGENFDIRNSNKVEVEKEELRKGNK